MLIVVFILLSQVLQCHSQSEALNTFVSLEEPACTCTDVTPPNSQYTCLQQRQWNKCDELWMISGDYCAVSCNRCNDRCSQQTDDGQQEKEPDCQCTDLKPPNVELSCYEQRRLGKCPADWMNRWREEAPQGYCEYTCGRCECTGTPGSRPQMPETQGGEDGCQCTDIPPKGKPFTCEQQKKYGKCQAIWMFQGPLQEGYCQTTCGRCPCQPQPTATLEVTTTLYPPQPQEIYPPPSPPLPSPSADFTRGGVAAFTQQANTVRLIIAPPLAPPPTETFILTPSPSPSPLPPPPSVPPPAQMPPPPFPPPLFEYIPYSDATYNGKPTSTIILSQVDEFVQQSESNNDSSPAQVRQTSVPALSYYTPTPTPNSTPTPGLVDIQTYSTQCDNGDPSCGQTKAVFAEEVVEPVQCYPVVQIFEESMNESFSMFQQLLQVSGYTSFLSAPVIPLTLMAPVNFAIDVTLRIMGMSFEELLDNPTLSAAVVRYHMIPAQFDLEMLVISHGPFSTFESNGVLFFEKDFSLYDAETTEYPGVRVVAVGNGARVIQSDIYGCNVFVHVIDSMLLPFIPQSPSSSEQKQVELTQEEEEQCPTIYEVLSSREDTEVYTALLEVVPEVKKFFQNPDFQATVLVPTDEAIDIVTTQRSLDSAIFFQEDAIALSLVSWSLISEVVLTNDIVESLPYATLLSTFYINFQFADGEWTVSGGVSDGARIIEEDIPACKSVIHIIDRLMIPNVQLDGAQPVSPTITDTQRAFKKSFPELSGLDLNAQNVDWIVTQFMNISGSPLSEEQIRDLYQTSNYTLWVENLNKHLKYMGLSDKEIKEFQQQAIDYLLGAEDPNQSVAAYRSARGRDFTPEGIDPKYLQNDTRSQMNWSLEKETRISSVYVAMYDTVRNAGSGNVGCYDLLQVLEISPELSTMYNILNQIGDIFFETYGENVTIFTPHNEAFEEYFKGDLSNFVTDNTDTLLQYLAHITIHGKRNVQQALDDGAIYSVNDQSMYNINNNVIQDFYGQPTDNYYIEYNGNSANIVRSHDSLCSGLLHVVDEIILPSSLQEMYNL